MSAEYKLLVRSKVGNKLVETGDFLELAYTKRVNEPGLLKFRLRGDHPMISQLQEDYRVEVWRRNLAVSLDWYVDFRGFFADYTFETKQNTVFTGSAFGELNLLARRVIAYDASSVDNQLTNFVNTRAETVMKRLVTYNASSAATVANGRDRNGAFDNFVITSAVDLGRGNTVSYAGSRKNLLTELQRLAEVAGGDFNLVGIGSNQWQFHFYPGQLGTDKSGSVVFSLSRGNMANPRVEVTARQAQVAVVGGQGQESARTIELAPTGTNPAAAVDGAEVFLDGRNDATGEALRSRGEIALAEAERKAEFSFDVLQTPTCYYGKHYALGDLVKAEYMDLSAIKGVRGVSVYAKDQGEEIKVEVGK